MARKKTRRGPPRPLYLALAAPLILAAAYSLWRPDADFDLLRRPADNGIWLERTWVEEEHSPAETRDLLRSLSRRGFRYFFVHHTPMNAAGRNPPVDVGQCRRLSAAARAVSSEEGRAVQVLPWVGGRSTVRLDSAAQRKAFAEDSAALLRTCGFDGLHLNIEPLHGLDRGILDWLDELRRAAGKDVFLSMAATRPHLLGTVDLSPIASWGPAEYRELSRHVDQIVVMSYDTWLVGEKFYVAYLRCATRLAAEAVRGGPNPGCSLLMGVPTYDEPRVFFHPGTENIRSAMAGILSANLDLRRAGARPVGLSVYAARTTDPSEWQYYESFPQEY